MIASQRLAARRCFSSSTPSTSNPNRHLNLISISSNSNPNSSILSKINASKVNFNPTSNSHSISSSRAYSICSTQRLSSSLSPIPTLLPPSNSRTFSLSSIANQPRKPKVGPYAEAPDQDHDQEEHIEQSSSDSAVQTKGKEGENGNSPVKDEGKQDTTTEEDGNKNKDEKKEVEKEKEGEKESSEQKGSKSATASTSSSSSSSTAGSSSSGSSSSGNSLTKQTVPSVYPQVLALPITRRPLFPGFYKAVVIKNPAVCAAIKESMARGQPYVGAFLLRNEEDDSDVITDLSKIHRTGVFCQITNVFPTQKSSSGLGSSSSKKKEKASTSEAGKDSEGKEKEKEKEEEEEEGITAVLYPHRRISIDELISPNGDLQPWPATLDTPTPPAPEPITSSSTSTSTDSPPTQDSTTSSSIEGGETAEAKVVKKEKVGEIIREAKESGIIPDENDASSSSSSSRHAAPFQTSFLQDYAVSLVNVSNLTTQPYNKEGAIIRAVKSELISVFKDIATLNPLFRDQITNFGISQGAGNVFDEPDKLADFAAAVSSGEVEELQAVLESLDVEERLQKSLLVLKKELINAELQSKISKDVESKIQKRQREYFLMEQLKGIKKELGMESDGKDKLIEKFKEKCNELNMPEAVKKVFDEELNKLQGLEPSASEFNVTRGYLDWLTNIPWGVNSTENYSIANASKILDQDHFGLKDVKDRILEFLAIGKLKGKVEGKILCLVGPPGVGKTSIGKSIANAIERKFFRFSVGGLSDVAEIKGHRRTYVGAMPGKSIQALKKVQVENPLILIDEVDKIGRGHNGDPSSALLEMLDPEQNSSFLDHYMDVPVNLSRVLFVCTANSLDTIPQPLLDRMEVIEVSSYTAEEKKNIAKDYLAPQAKETSGLQNTNISLPDETIEFLIRYHSRESGVRGLRKLFEKIYRKIAFEIVRDYGEDVFPEPKKEPTDSKDGKVEFTTSTPNSDSAAAGGTESNTQSVTPPPTPDSSSSSSSSPSSSSTSESSSTSTPKTTTSEREPLSVPSSVSKTITIQSLKKYLGPPSYSKDRMFSKGSTPEGVSIGLGYLGNGSGSLMPIETALIPSKNGGSLKLTGKLGEVIKESASVALSWMKSNVKDLGIASTNTEESEGKDKDKDGESSSTTTTASPLSRNEIHLHMPEGAIGKEGPSAGVAFVTSLVSLLTQKRLPSDLAMTGEVSLRGLGEFPSR